MKEAPSQGPLRGGWAVSNRLMVERYPNVVDAKSFWAAICHSTCLLLPETQKAFMIEAAQSTIPEAEH